jgi:hypothetical protein
MIDGTKRRAVNGSANLRWRSPSIVCSLFQENCFSMSAVARVMIAGSIDGKVVAVDIKPDWVAYARRRDAGRSS